MGYPSATSEHAIARRHQAEAEPLDRVPTVAAADTVLALRDTVRGIRVADEVEAYLVGLVRATRAHPDVRLGASPRSSVALYRAAQAWAALAGRDYVLPDDAREVAHAVLDHRILLDLDRELRGATPEAVVDAVLAEVPVPLAE
jgi:MoxR-like ATPase